MMPVESLLKPKSCESISTSVSTTSPDTVPPVGVVTPTSPEPYGQSESWNISTFTLMSALPHTDSARLQLT